MDEFSGWRDDGGIMHLSNDMSLATARSGVRSMRSGTDIAHISEEELVGLLRSGDQAAMGILYDKYAAALYGVILRIVRSEESAEDLLQETYVKIWMSFSTYDGSKGRLFTWMMRVARNLALDKVKSKEFRNARKNHDTDSLVTLVDKQSSMTYEPDHVGLTDIIHSSLNPDSEKLVRLIYFQGYTQAEAAHELGIPLGTVKTRLRAAIAIIRKIFS